MDQNRAARGCYRADRFLEGIDCRAAPNDVVERVAAGGISAESLILTTQFNNLCGASNRDSDFVNESIRSLLDVIKRAGLYCLHSRIKITCRGDEDNSRFGG